MEIMPEDLLNLLVWRIFLKKTVGTEYEDTKQYKEECEYMERLDTSLKNSR